MLKFQHQDKSRRDMCSQAAGSQGILSKQSWQRLSSLYMLSVVISEHRYHWYCWALLQRRYPQQLLFCYSYSIAFTQGHGNRVWVRYIFLNYQFIFWLSLLVYLSLSCSTQAQQLWHESLVVLQHLGSQFPDQDQTRVALQGRFLTTYFKNYIYLFLIY